MRGVRAGAWGGRDGGREVQVSGLCAARRRDTRSGRNEHWTVVGRDNQLRQQSMSALDRTDFAALLETAARAQSSAQEVGAKPPVQSAQKRR